jgi:hypothetical protein
VHCAEYLDGVVVKVMRGEPGDANKVRPGFF